MDVQSSTNSAPSKQIISEAKRKAVVYLLTLFHLRKKMSGFLDKPKTEKSQECNEGNGLKYGVVSMQGWCVEMEDSHSAVIGLPGDFKGNFNVTFVSTLCLVDQVISKVKVTSCLSCFIVTVFKFSFLLK
jgi:hypothetical protein